MPDIRCADCGHTTAIEESAPLVCEVCARPLDVTIELETGVIAERRTVLIVDDEPDVRALARTMLGSHGFDVVGEASNGPDAALLAAEHQPSVVVLDQRMPAMSGEHTAKLLKRVSPSSLIVVFSAVVDRRPEWADAVVRKVDVDVLADVVGSVTRSRTAPEG